MEKNLRLFPIYRMFSYDTLFYYAISVLYLTITKGLTFSQFALITTCYALASILFQIPAAAIVEKLGYKKSLMLGNICCVIWAIIYICSGNFIWFAIGELISGFGFALKSTSESPYIYATLSSLGRTSEFSKYESKGSSLFFTFEAFASIATGYLFLLNAYIPIIVAGCCSLISFILLFSFTQEKQTIQKTSVWQELHEMSDSFKYIFNSNRLRALLLYSALTFGTMGICAVIMRALYQQLGLTSTGFGYIFALIGISAALGSKLEEKFEKRHRNKTLSVILMLYISLLLIVGIFNISNIPTEYIIAISLLCFIVQYYIKGMYRVIMKEYISRYSTSRIQPKIMSSYYLFEFLGYAICTSILAMLLDVFSLDTLIIVIPFVLCILAILVMKYMNSRVGLNPDSYTARDRLDR